MARKASPWWWENEKGWYVNYQGRRRFLGKHPEGAKPPAKSKRTGKWNAPQEIEDAFHRLMTGQEDVAPAPAEQVSQQPAEVDESGTVLAMFKSFNKWCKENRGELTARGYKDILEDFINFESKGEQIGLLPADKVNAGHVTAWLESQTTWGPTTRRNAITAIQRAFNWCVGNLGLARNPIQGMHKPTAKRRSSVVTPAELEKILQNVSAQLADLLTVTYDSGARPQEVKRLEARHIDFENQRAVIPADEAKGRQHARVIYLPTEESLAIVRRLCEKYPQGPIFRNSKGNAWTGDAVKCAFARLADVIGRTVKHYDFRRTFITRKIIAGVDSHVVAKLAGHQTTAMIDKHYSCIADDAEFMLQQAQKDIKPKEEE